MSPGPLDSVEKDFDGLALVLVADFDAPIERVWELWADPRQLERWWRVTAVAPPTSLEFTDGFANRDGTPNAETPTTAVQMRLSAQGGGTRMELRFVFASSEHMQQLERWGAFEVFPQSVGQMDALLAA